MKRINDYLNEPIICTGLDILRFIFAGVIAGLAFAVIVFTR